MAHTYLGVDEPSAIIPGSPTFGYGVFPIPTVTDDQDDRDAASANLAAEADTDRSNFLAWRMINIIEGGIYVFTALISTFNNWLFRGAVDFFAATKIKSTGSLTTDGPVTINANTVISPTAAVLRQCFERRTGAGAWNGARVQTGANADVNPFDASAADTTRIPALTASRTYNIIDPGGATAMGVTHTFERAIVGTNGFDLLLNDAANSVFIAVLTNGTNKRLSMTIQWTGSAWVPIVYSAATTAGTGYIQL